jgi:argininosuccinate lyase
VIGDLVSLLVTLKGLPLAYNRDMQEDKEPVFDAVDTAVDSLLLIAGAVRTLAVRREAMARAAADPLLLATDLAEHLVARGVPFREAHECVGRLVAHAVESGTPLDRMPASELRRFHPELDLEPRSFFTAERSLEARGAVGGPARGAVLQALGAAREELAATASELREQR